MSAPATSAPPRMRPVIVLADASGSMSADGKIGVLQASIEQLAHDLAAQPLDGEQIEVAVIAFGGERARLLQPSAAEPFRHTLQAEGGTPLGAALRLARELLDDPRQVPDESLRATLVLASDGRATDDWRPAMEALLASARTATALRFAIAIGADADRSMLRRFLQGTNAPVLDAYEAGDIAERFRYVTSAIAPHLQTLGELDLGPAVGLDVAPAPAAVPTPAADAGVHPTAPAYVPDGETRTAEGSVWNDPGKLGPDSSTATRSQGSAKESATADRQTLLARLGAFVKARARAEEHGENREENEEALAAGDELVAEDGRVWRVERELDRGGQGRVYTLMEGSLVAKVLNASSSTTPAELRERLAQVQRLPLDGLPIARPLVRLRSRTGYVMRLVDGVAPLRELADQPRTHDARPWYARTGGARRRLLLLARLADVLERLHARGIVYGDLSLANVLVSTSPEHYELWLIDPDNLRYTTAPGSGVHTPGFSAPELLKPGATATTLADAYALAVTIYRTLTATPLSERETEDRLHVGAEVLLPGRLLALAGEVFTVGADPAHRPRPGAWAAELQRAADLCVECPACEQTYPAPGTHACPWCGAPRPRLALIAIGTCDEHGVVHLGERSPRVLAREGSPLLLTRRHVFAERDFAAQHEPAGTLRLAGELVQLEAASPGIALAEQGRVRPLDPGERVELPAFAEGAPDRWALHLVAPDEPHRLARLQVIPEPRP